MRFDELDLSDDVLDALDAMRFETCSPIQEQAIPPILEGRDLIGVAQTGTGKTAAYLLPVIDRLASMPEAKDYVNCVVMAPTRELAQQIDRQMEGFAYFLPVSSVAIYGGTDGAGFAQQQRGLKMGADVVIATPGRLLAHIQMGYVDLSRVSHLILDEADRMLDMGFYDDIMQIVKLMPKDRQTLMFSATMPPKIQQLARSILSDPVEVKIAVSRPTEAIDQSKYVCHEGQKTPLLLGLLQEHSTRVIVFSSSKLKVKDLTRELRRKHVKAGEMHSDLDQTQRDEAMHAFRSGKLDVLVATDILARGIDIDDIAMVVNYDVPHEAEDYVHRIGRTARAGAGGTAVTLVSQKEQRKFGSIEKFLGYEVRTREISQDLGQGPDYRPDRGGDGGGRHGRSDRARGPRSGRNGSGHGRGRSDRGQRSDRPARKDSSVPQSAAPQQPAAPAPEAQADGAQAQNAKTSGSRRRRGHHGRGRSRKGGSSAPQAPQA